MPSRSGAPNATTSPTATTRPHPYGELGDVITRWEENLEDRRLIKHALALYADVEAAREQMMDVADRAMR
jgi:hypothetical protein